MLGLKYFGKHKKIRNQESDTPKVSPRAASTPPEESTSSTTSSPWKHIFHRRESSNLTRSTQESKSRPVSQETVSSVQSAPTTTRTVSEALVTPTSTSQPTSRPTSDRAESAPLLRTDAPASSHPNPTSATQDTVTGTSSHPKRKTTESLQEVVSTTLVNPANQATSSSSPTTETTTTPHTSTIPTRMPSMLPSRLSSSGNIHGMNGSNSVFSPPHSPKATFRSKGRLPSFTSSRAASGNFSTVKSFSKRTNGASGYKIGFVQESAISLRKKSMAEVGAGVYQSISDVSYVKFLEWIRSERLTTLPHKGSRWDKVLIRALYFAEQLHKFDQAIKEFAVDSGTAAAIGFGHAQLLLELGHENSEALDKAFSVFYKFALSFSSALQRSELLAGTSEIREQLCLLYTDLLSLVVDVSIRFYKTANGMTSGSVTLDIFDIFGDTIETFRTRRDTVVELIWQHQIEKDEVEEDEVVDVKVLSRWLAPQDRVLESLNRDHSTYVDQQVEFTCLWFQKHLTRFIQSNKSFLLVTGQAGTGKTTLAGSIVERLQRPVNRKQYDTLFCSLSPDIPTTATSLAVVKSLLYQLLNLRVGNMGMYYALFRAYHQCHSSSDLGAYEELLWQALADTLKHPLDGGNELVIVVDGLDEIAESQSASIQASGAVSPAALLERLVSVTNEGHGVRLITLSSSIKNMPSGANVVHHEVSRSDVRDDLHAVALRALINNHNFHSQKAHDQETMLDRLIQTANGSFLWTILACQILNAQKTPEAVSKVLENLESTKPSAQDLVLRLFTSFDITDETKLLLSWILAAERPLTLDEIHILFTVDVQRGTVADKGINVMNTISTLRPLLTIHERIVRFKHPIIHHALHEFANQKKIPIQLKESETDLLLRVLTYAKYNLRDKGEPTLDALDTSLSDRLFRQHPLLEYTVRYWVLHLQQSPLAPNSGEYKPTAELQKVFPDTTVLAVLEQFCWDTQLPTPHALDLHRLAVTVRRGVFTDNHPSVLQTYLAIATSYLLISKTTEASQYYYWSTKIGTNVLSPIHPLTLECASSFLKITESMSTTTRTELMTRREEVLIILITAYERQYGSTSELVIQTRQLLMELYASIHEEEKAVEVYRLIEEATIQQYGRKSHQAQDLQAHLSVVLHKGEGGGYIDGYNQKIFDEEDDEGDMETFDIGSIAIYLRRIKEYISKKEFSLAEKTYVELWTEVSSKCRTVQSLEWHEKNVEIATAYSQFLKSQKRTSESSAILMTVWQQYEHHQLSYSERIVSRLSVVAKEMKSMGMYASALSIFSFASSYYKNVRQEETSISIEINNEVSETSTELVKQSLESSSTITETTTTTVSDSTFRHVFFSVIESEKTVKTSTIKLSKKLTAQYMENKNYSAAVKVIHATLQRTWASFLSSSIQNVTMTSTFSQESIELVENLAECYLHMKQLEKVEDVYNRFFRATLVSEEVDKSIFERAKTLLINYYDKHGYADHAISILQEILVVYRTRYGPTHELTIQILYILARRCQSHPRNHPYWIEYYLQIITSLNKDTDLCHKDALDAIIVVTNTYWEDRRYAEAVTIYGVLWNTFIKQTKVHKVFSDTKFVQMLYEHYYQCLEETKASYSSLYEVTKEYRETCVATFSADSTIAIEASLSLAQVAQQSEEHYSTAISLYEEVSESGKTITTTKTTVTEVNQALSSLYIKQMHSSKSSSLKAEVVIRAISMIEEQYTQCITQYGYAQETSLTQLRELSMLYHKQQKTDVAIKQLTTAVSEIVSKETSSLKMIESASFIAASFHAIEQTSTAQSLVQELHRQICAKESRYASKWSFDLTKSERSALAFLASLQYHLQKDYSITIAEIMADLTMEYLYFEYFRSALQRNESLTNILLAAAPLRWFLRRTGQTELITVVESQAVTLFVKRDAQDLNTLSKDSPRIFIVGILDRLGKGGHNADFNRAVILSSNDNVTKLTKSKHFAEAYDIAHLAFLYASNHDAYNEARAIGMGFKLASLLVGLRDGEKCPDAALRKKMLELSNRIVKKILDICMKLKINFAQVQLYELSQLSVLLGEQEDYATLEWLLTTLWNTRDAQRSWPAPVLLALGRRLICARYLAGHPVKAIRLCEDIAYNMRRAHGARAPVTIAAYELLAQLYTSTAFSYQAKASSEKAAGPLAEEYFRKALGVHGDVLKLLVGQGAHGGAEDEDSDDEDAAAALLAKEGVRVHSHSHSTSNIDGNSSAIDVEEDVDRSVLARKHLHLLKLAYQRLGHWPKDDPSEFERLVAKVLQTFAGQGLKEEGVEKWDASKFGAGKAESEEGGFGGVDDWSFASASSGGNVGHKKEMAVLGARGANGAAGPVDVHVDKIRGVGSTQADMEKSKVAERIVGPGTTQADMEKSKAAEKIVGPGTTQADMEKSKAAEKTIRPGTEQPTTKASGKANGKGK